MPPVHLAIRCMAGSKQSFFNSSRAGLSAFDPPIEGPAELALEFVLATGQTNRAPAAVTGRTLRLIGPGDVLNLSSDVVTRAHPPDGTADCPYNLFAALEFGETDEDLPWRLSGAATQGRLKPWLTLIVLRESEDVIWTAPSARAPGLLRVHGVARAMLPALTQAHLTAHVYGDEKRGVARLVAATPLQPGTRYLAALVPTLRAALDDGPEPPTSDVEAPAWTTEELAREGGVVELPTYYAWRFATAEWTDFAELAERLHGLPDAARDGLGVRPLLVGPCPHVQPSAAPDAWTQTYAGVLVAGPPPAPTATPAQAAWFAAALAAAPYDPLKDDPTLEPPRYGASLTNRKPPPTWQATLHTTPMYRTLAGIGAEVVRHHQEALTSELLDRLEAQRDEQAVRRRTQLSATIALSRTGRLTSLADASLMATTRFITGAVSLPNNGQDAWPSGLGSASMSRQTRGGAAAGRAVRRRATGRARSPVGALMFRVDSGALDHLRGWDPHAKAATRNAGPLATSASSLRTTLRPLTALRRPANNPPAVLQGLAGGFAQYFAGLVQIAPPDFTLSQPLSAWIREIDPDLLVPGIGALPLHSVTLLEVHRAAIEAIMIGANEALAREIRWRDLPVPRGATLMRRFWEGGAGDDITAISGWKAGLGLNVGSGSNLVLVLRSPLLRMYPALGIAIVESDGQRPKPATRKAPRFRGLLAADTLYAGFDVTAAQARGGPGKPGWFIELSQPADFPAFGTDIDDQGTPKVAGKTLAAALSSAAGAAALAAALLRKRGRVFIHASFLL